MMGVLYRCASERPQKAEVLFKHKFAFYRGILLDTAGAIRTVMWQCEKTDVIPGSNFRAQLKETNNTTLFSFVQILLVSVSGHYSLKIILISHNVPKGGLPRWEDLGTMIHG